MQFTCVVAIGPDGQIGANNNLPWIPATIRGDMNFFKKITSSNVIYSENGTIINVIPAADMVNVVIMGRKTWESIPLKFRPLDSRFNIIITSSNQSQKYEGTDFAFDFEEALRKAETHILFTKGQIFIIGGSSVYDLALSHSGCTGVFLTEISGPMLDGDVFFQVHNLRSSSNCLLVNQIGFDLIKNSCKNVHYDGDYIYEKEFKYQFKYYHKLK